MSDISVIIVNWNGRHLLADCLDALLAQDFSDFEIILVDNGSADGSADFVEECYPQVKLVRLAENRGFTGGNLAGYAEARGAFVALLNNDTRPEPGWLNALHSRMRSDLKIGICASAIVIDGTDRFDAIGDRFTTAFSGTKIGSLRPRSEFPGTVAVHGGCAAAILYRREMLEEIGFLDDDFYFNHEDTDLNLRAWLSGWRAVYVPDAVVHHKVSASIGELSAAGVYYFSRNSEWVWLKNVPLPLMIRYLPHRVLYEIAAFLFYGIRSRRVVPFLKGKRDALLKAPTMLRKRRAVQKMVRLANADIAAGLTPVTGYLWSRLRSSRS